MIFFYLFLHVLTMLDILSVNKPSELGRFSLRRLLRFLFNNFDSF